MKKYAILLTIVLFFLSFSACDDSSGSSDNTTSSSDIENLPTDFSVSLPDSIRASEAREINREVTIPEGSLGFKELQKARFDMEKESGFVAGLFVLADRTITENGGKDVFTDKFTEGVKFQITQELYDTMIEVGNGKVQEGFEVGKEFAFPKFQYVPKDRFEATIPDENKKLKDQITKLKELYDYLFIAAAEGEVKEDGGVDKKDSKSRLVYIFWDDAKKNTRVISYEKQKLDVIEDEQHRVLDIIFEDREGGKFSTITRAEDFPPYVWENGKWTLKTTQEGEALGVGRDVDLMILTLEEKDPDNKGVVINLFRKKRRLNGDVTKPEAMENLEHKLYGYADNSGGFVESFIKATQERKPDSTKFFGFSTNIAEKRYEELFKSDGTLFAARFIKLETGEWENAPGYTWPASNDDEQGHKAKFKEYKDKFLENQEKFAGDKGAEGAKDSYKADNEYVFDVILPDVSAQFGVKKVLNFVIVKDGQVSTWPDSTYWKYVLGFASIDQKKYDELKAGGDVKLTFAIKLSPEAGFADMKTLPGAFDLHLVTGIGAQGEITSSSKYDISKTSDAPLEYK